LLATNRLQIGLKLAAKKEKAATLEQKEKALNSA